MRLKLVFALVVSAQWFFFSVSSTSQQSRIVVSSEEEIKAEFDAVPCKENDRLQAVQALFQKMGAAASDMSVEKYKNVTNLVVRKQGTTQEIIVVGAHYDKVSEGCGAVDNWTGIVTLAHLYKSLKDVPRQKTILFVAFDKEEEGLIGSHAMAEAIKDDQLARYCVMLNFDSFGLAAPQAADNMSTRKLETFAADVAKDLKMPFSHASIPNAGADSNSFIRRKIPAITIHGMNDDWPKILHTRNDQPAKVNSRSVYLGYRLALLMLTRLDESSCDAYR